MNDLPACSSQIVSQIVVRDKDGNIKYEGPLVMNVVHEKGEDDGGDSPHCGSHGDR
jgi:hypothetical protein